MSIGWRSPSSSVAFSSFEKAKIAVFAYISAFEAKFQAIIAKIHPEMNCKAWKSAKDAPRVTWNSICHRYTTPYIHRTRKSKMKDFLEFFGKSAILRDFPY